MDIEGKLYENVVVVMKSNTPDYVFSDKSKIKVTITDSNGEVVWKKKMKNAYLFVFSNGQVQVGKPNFNQILITKSTITFMDDYFIGKIREKEGIY